MPSLTSVRLHDIPVRVPALNSLILGHPESNGSIAERYTLSDILALIGGVNHNLFSNISLAGTETLLAPGNYIIDCSVSTEIVLEATSGAFYNLMNSNSSVGYCYLKLPLTVEGLALSVPIILSPGQMISLLYVGVPGFKLLYSDPWLTQVITVSNLFPTECHQATLKVKQSCILRRYIFNKIARLRLYITEEKATADKARAVGTRPTGLHGMFSEIIPNALNLDFPAYALNVLSTDAAGSLHYTVENIGLSPFTTLDPLTISIQFN